MTASNTSTANALQLRRHLPTWQQWLHGLSSLPATSDHTTWLDHCAVVTIEVAPDHDAAFLPITTAWLADQEESTRERVHTAVAETLQSSQDDIGASIVQDDEQGMVIESKIGIFLLAQWQFKQRSAAIRQSLSISPTGGIHFDDAGFELLRAAACCNRWDGQQWQPCLSANAKRGLSLLANWSEPYCITSMATTATRQCLKAVVVKAGVTRMMILPGCAENFT